MRRDGATSCCRCRWPRPPWAPTASSSRRIPRPTRRSATARSSSCPTSSASTFGRSRRRRSWRARSSVASEPAGPPRIAVLGVGLIGGSIGLAARAGGAWVVGYDPDAAVLATALSSGAIDAAAGSVAEAVGGAAADAPGGAGPVDAVFTCAPVGVLPALVDEALAAAGPDTVVTDVGSTKRLIAAHVNDERFIGGHPIARSEAAGVEHAPPDPFRGAGRDPTPPARP